MSETQGCVRRRATEGFHPAGRIAAAVLAASLAACADSNVTRTSSDGPNDPPPIQTGVFKDSNVGGLDFVSGRESGVTDGSGRFTCETDEPVAFSIGALELGETLCATLVHPPALTPSGSFDAPEALNIARLLLILDSDGATDNGITISDPMRSVAGSWPAVDFAAADFFGELTQIVADIASVEGRTIGALPTAAEALAHLDASLACAYSGVFGATPATGPYAEESSVALTIRRNPSTGTDDFFFLVYRVNSRAQMFVSIGGLVDLKTLPSLEGSNTSPAPTLSAAFTSPDIVSGRWSNPATEHSVDREVSFRVRRLGGAAGEYRFTGSYGNTSAYGVVALTLAGDAIEGEALDMYNNAVLAVTGSRLAGSNTVEMDILGQKATGTLELGADGAPLSLQGAWPFEGGTFRAEACRLN